MADPVPEAPVLEVPVLEVVDLQVSFGSGKHKVTVVHDVSLRIERGEIVGVVGESGSGKTLTAMAATDLLPSGAKRDAKVWRFEGTDLLGAKRSQRAAALGGKLGVVFQDPMSSLNPARKIGNQLSDTARFWGRRSRSEARTDAVDRLGRVRIAAPERRVDDYPHEFSGGMRQRVMIAMGLMSTPSLIVADEPTTALDVTVQADVMNLLRELNEQEGTAVVLVSHNIALIAEICHRVVVMYAGRIVEEISAEHLASSARHPYTRALIGSVPTLEASPDEELSAIGGHPPDPANLPVGCAFADRCPLVVDHCRVERPPLIDGVACWEVD
ncbi:MAG TPA: ABC transporter ATP-binding protein [Microthrixaceae bacterium]|nr:ABC transporter ATP-binding protein [Microthrixaceae bacterium]